MISKGATPGLFGVAQSAISIKGNLMSHSFVFPLSYLVSTTFKVLLLLATPSDDCG